jgi:hypothetical protein
MTDPQFFLLIGTIWIAPHAKEWYGDVVGLTFVFLGIFKHMGWT